MNSQFLPFHRKVMYKSVNHLAWSIVRTQRSKVYIYFCGKKNYDPRILYHRICSKVEGEYSKICKDSRVSKNSYRNKYLMMNLANQDTNQNKKFGMGKSWFKRIG